MSAPRRIWVTRTRPQADATADALRAMGLEAVVEPVLTVRPRGDAVLDLAGADAIAFTSGHAARAFASLCPARDLTAFAVGETTAALARALGFTKVLSGDGDVAALARLIGAATPRPALVCNPTALEPAADLALLLERQGIRTRVVTVYETVAADVAEVPDGADAVLVQSAKAARMVATLVSSARAPSLQAFAISEAAAGPLRALPFATIATAPFPNEAALLDLLQG